MLDLLSLLMLEALKQYISDHKLFSKSDKLLIAFSGGVDSVVMTFALKELGYAFDLAHCNFGLRGKESDGDEKFCSDFAKKMKLKFLCQKFNTKNFAKKNDLSVQMAARQLRYDWFKELSKENTYNFVLTAHHSNDNVETLLINLVRGTGINGLKGISKKQNFIVRPLLSFTKKEIEDLARENKLKFRNDSSNDEVKYKRNFLRHKVIPHLKKLNPSLEQTFAHNIELFNAAAEIVKIYVETKAKELSTSSSGELKIDIQKLISEKQASLLLFEMLNPLGFNNAQVNAILKSLENKSAGKLFTSATHKLIIDRHFLIAEALKKESKKEFIIKDLEAFKKLPVKIDHKLTNDLAIESAKANAQLDYGKLEFPLRLRKWKTGDKFKPLGVNGFKKLSDFFTNQKLNRFEKEDTWLLINKNDIVWVVGYRIDDRYKITDATKKVLKLKLI
jgi:tRNA(Ile)-lysidine synthase